MSTVLVNINQWLENLRLSVESTFKVIILSKFHTSISRLKTSNDQLLILANGPSLNSFLSTFDKFQFYDLLMVNLSPLTDDFKRLRPSYYLTSAPELWRTNVKREYIVSSEKLFTALKNNVTWPMHLFIPFEAKKFSKWQLMIKENNNIKVVFFNNTPIDGFTIIKHFFFSNNLGMPRPHNVLIPSLMMAISMKYKQILLAGVDHSWLGEISVTNNNEALVCQKHFYDEDTATSQTMNQAGIRTRRLHEILHKFYLTFKGYFEIEEYAVYKRVKIINTTPNSFIDAFEKKSLK
jgi:hypothetical protein